MPAERTHKARVLSAAGVALGAALFGAGDASAQASGAPASTPPPAANTRTDAPKRGNSWIGAGLALA